MTMTCRMTMELTRDTIKLIRLNINMISFSWMVGCHSGGAFRRDSSTISALASGCCLVLFRKRPMLIRNGSGVPREQRRRWKSLMAVIVERRDRELRKQWMTVWQADRRQGCVFGQLQVAGNSRIEHNEGLVLRGLFLIRVRMCYQRYLYVLQKVWLIKGNGERSSLVL